MPITVNGRQLGVAVNGVFSDANTDPIPGGRLWSGGAAQSWNAMRASALADGVPAWEFMPAGPNSSARGRPAQVFFWNHRPPPAAFPGTSNHGWALAVDVRGFNAQTWLLNHAAAFGWSHDEGARVGERWHFRYVGGWKGSTSSGGRRVLRRGTRGQDVRALQRALRALHVKGAPVVSGYMGAATVKAVKRFQKKHHAKADGVVGPQTWLLLRRATHES